MSALLHWTRSVLANFERAAQRNPGPFKADSSKLSGDLRKGTYRPLPERRISLIYGRVLQRASFGPSAWLDLINVMQVGFDLCNATGIKNLLSKFPKPKWAEYNC